MTTPRRAVVLGGSAAGWSVVRTLQRHDFAGDILVVDPDPETPYRRPAVSKGLLTGAHDLESVRLPAVNEGWRRLAGRALRVDPTARTVLMSTDDGELPVAYTDLVVATGADAVLPALGSDQEGHHVLRSARDAAAVGRAVGAARSAVIVGGGFLGLEAAASLRHHGLDVTVVEMGLQLLGGRLGEALSDQVRRLHEDRGVDLRLGQGVVAADRVGCRSRLSLDDGRELVADVVIWAVGARPSMPAIDGHPPAPGGLVCDQFGRVDGLTSVYAAGDVASWWNPRYDQRVRTEHWTSAVEQGGVVGALLAGADVAPLAAVPYVWSDQYEYKFQMLGLPSLADSTEVLSSEDGLIVGYLRAGALVGAAGLNAHGASFMAYRKRILEESLVPSRNG